MFFSEVQKFAFTNLVLNISDKKGQLNFENN